MSFLADPLSFLYFVAALVVSVTIHEAAHAWSADRLGDSTARRLGRVTLNPLKHLDPMGTIMMVVAALAGFGIGWGKPTPVNPWNLRIGAKRGMALVALAGPVSNVLLAALAARLFKYDLVALDPFDPSPLAMFLRVLLIVNVYLALFNMLPIPPLDGFRVLVGALPDRPASTVARLEQYGPGILLLVVVLGMGIVGQILSVFAGPVFRLITL